MEEKKEEPVERGKTAATLSPVQGADATRQTDEAPADSWQVQHAPATVSRARFSSAPTASASGTPARGQIPRWEEVAAFWAAEGLTAEAQAFFDHYQARHWRGRDGAPLHSWQWAARNWERIFLRDIVPIRQKVAAKTAAQQAARACSYAEAKAAFERALLRTGGDEAAALELLKHT